MSNIMTASAVEMITDGQIENAVNKLRDGRLARLKIYADDQHAHAPQQPEKISVKETK